MLKFLIIISILLTLIADVNAQKDNDKYSVDSFIGIGDGMFISDLHFDGLNKNSSNAIIRFMWKPEHLLSVGLETGFGVFYTTSQENVDTEYGVTDIETTLFTVPIFIVYSMEIFENFDLSVGMGPQILFSKVDSHNNKVTSTQISSGYMFSGYYMYPLSSGTSLGGGFRWNYVQKIHDGSLFLQIMFKYNLIEY